MEQLVILLLFVGASIVSSIIQSKKKREEAAREGLPPAAPRRPFEQWPQTPGDWQEELRRLLDPEREKTPPVIVAPPPPVITAPPRPARLFERSEGDEHIGATGKLQDRVHNFMHAGHKHVPRPVQGPLAAILGRRHTTPSPMPWTRDPQAVREAFIASLVFSPPPGLDRR